VYVDVDRYVESFLVEVKVIFLSILFDIATIATTDHDAREALSSEQYEGLYAFCG
jgi:hypothetical protein